MGTENQTLAYLILKLNLICAPPEIIFPLLNLCIWGSCGGRIGGLTPLLLPLLGDSLPGKVPPREKATHYYAGLDHRNILSFVYCDQLNPLLLEPGLASILGIRPAFPEFSKHVTSSLGLRRLERQVCLYLSSLCLYFQKCVGSQSWSRYATRCSSIFGQSLGRALSGLSLGSPLVPSSCSSWAPLDIRLHVHRCSVPVLRSRFQKQFFF